VPVDHAEPNGETLQLALVRIPATDPSSRIGPLLVNPGGPGGSGIDLAENNLWSPAISRHFDIIGFDPRGVGASTPLECNDTLEQMYSVDPAPRTPAAVADVVGLSAVAVRAVLHRWNDHGPDGVADRRKGNGADPKLTARQRAALYAALQKRPPDGGAWTGPKVARYVRDRWRVSVRPEAGWRWLVALGFTLQVPRPAHPRAADPATRRRWKKTMPASLTGGLEGDAG
jgi:transposase